MRNNSSDKPLSIRAAVETIEAKRQNYVFCAILLDVSGAFDNASHVSILYALKQAKISKKLYNIIESYLNERKAELTSNEILVSIEPDNGCPQGSCSGPGLWKVIFNTLLEIMKKHKNAIVQGYADDTYAVWYGAKAGST